jgi:Mrp family chromosome partitioning ATPase
VLSGKGGVGKSTLTSQLARALAKDNDLDVGVLDADICGPSIPRMFGLENKMMHSSQLGLSPVFTGNHDQTDEDDAENISVVSIGFLLQDSKDAVIWRGNRKTGMLKQFLRDVHWDRCDYLLIDTPPGTSDEHLGLVQLCKPLSGAILITTPQEISWQDVRKEIDFCRKVKLPILGLVVNMAEFVCPSCSMPSEIFPDDRNIDKWASEQGISILSRIPLDPRIGKVSDSGKVFYSEYPDSVAAKAYLNLATKIRELLE